MKFVEALRKIVNENSLSMRRPEMAGDVRSSYVYRYVTVAVDVSTFASQVSSSGTYVFSYDGTNWIKSSASVTLSTYGITLTWSTGGSPVLGDVLTVVYVAASGSSSASISSKTYSKVQKVNVVFNHWSVEDISVSGDTTIGLTVDDSGEILNVTDVTIPSGLSFTLDAYFMTMLLASDWFVSSTSDADRSYNSTGHVW